LPAEQVNTDQRINRARGPLPSQFVGPTGSVALTIGGKVEPSVDFSA
jgi:hypothetical protein